MKPLHQGDILTQKWVAHIVDGFEAKTLPKPEWTHCAHLVTGTALVTKLGLVAAEAAMPEMIRQYNEATGVKNTDMEGYHHTITISYLRLVAGFIEGTEEKSFTESAKAILAHSIAAPSCLLKFYSKEILFSVAARQGWVSPDLQALDFAASG